MIDIQNQWIQLAIFELILAVIFLPILFHLISKKR